MTAPRRGFLKALAVAPMLPGALVTETPQAAPGASGEDESVAEALAEAVKRQFGAHLDDQELVEVRQEIERNRKAAARLRAVARLTNADDPVGRFEARPPAGRGQP